MTSNVSLSASCVFFDTEEKIFNKTLSSLAYAVREAKTRQIISEFTLHLINNNPKNRYIFQRAICDHHLNFEKIVIHEGHGNIGYGRGNNLAINQANSTYHLIINPDLELAYDSLIEGVTFLEEETEAVLVAPNAKNEFDKIEYLAKRQPSLLIILLRGLNNQFLNNLFKSNLSNYAYMDLIPSPAPVEIELASGCFMLCRTKLLKQCSGFSPEYFLYFEDFDLSKKIRRFGKIFYLPSMKVIHLGGRTAKKGAWHIYLFFKSALRFFLIHNSFTVKFRKNTDK